MSDLVKLNIGKMEKAHPPGAARLSGRIVAPSAAPRQKTAFYVHKNDKNKLT